MYGRMSVRKAVHDPAGPNQIDGIAGGGILPFCGYSHEERKLRNCLASGPAALICLLAIPAYAQFDTGVISGRVTDATGAVVARARIVVVQQETNLQSVSLSDTDGLYRVPSLRDGIYKVTVGAPGFKTNTRDGIILRIAENLLYDVKLEVGAVTETIEVTSALPLLETQNSVGGQVMEGAYFYELPNYQHWERGVLYYTPQVESTNAPWPGSLGNWNINGANSSQTAQYEDGQLVSTMNGGVTMNSISVADEEIKVITSAMPAEYGHATAGAISIVKKAGTNQFHGEGGELFKNNPLIERRFFQEYTNPQLGIASLGQQPDFVISGPVWIPHIYNGKNKTFFEVGGSYQLGFGGNSGSYSVPTASELAGQFNWTVTGGGSPNVLYDPGSTTGSSLASTLKRTPFPNNTIPTARFSSMWNAIAANNPFLPPQAGAGTLTNTGPNGNIVGSGTGNYYNLATQFRVDHAFTDKFKMSLSYVKNNIKQPIDNVEIAYKPYDQYQDYTPTYQNAAHLGFTYTISPTLISETSVGEYRQVNNPYLTDPSYQYSLTKTVPNLPSNVYVNPIGFGLTEGSNGGTQFGVGTLSVAVNNNHQVREDVTKVWGTHAFKMGWEWLWQNYVSHNIGNPRLTLGFQDAVGYSSTGATLPNTGGITIADLMLGYISSYTYSQQGTSLLPVDSIQSGYFQDDWRIHSKLTLNLGIRWSSETPAHGKFPGSLSNGSLTTPDDVWPQSVGGLLTCPAGGCVGGWVQPKNFVWNRIYDHFTPRFGLAWNVEPKTVVRAGFAMLTLDYNLGYTQQAEIGGGSFFNNAVTEPANTYTPLFNINSGVPAPVYPALQANGSLPTVASTPSARGTITVYPQNFHNSYTLNWNVSVQHALKKNYVVELSYVGLHNVGFASTYNWDSRPYGTGIDASGNVIDLTQPANWAYRNTWITNSSGVNGTQAYKPFPNWGGVNYECTCSMYIFHSGTIKLEKRYSYGLSFLAFFTYQKGISNAPGNLYTDQNEGRAVSGTTQKYRLVTSMTYDLPFGKGQHWMNQGKWKNIFLGGFHFSWNYSIWAPTPAGLGYSGQSVINPVTGAVGARQDYPSNEPLPGGGLYLIQDPKLRSNWQDIGTNRFVQGAQNPIVTNCGVTPILQANGATWGNNCVVIAPSFTNGNLPGNEWIEQRIIGANASMFKDISITEKVRAVVRLDYYNPFKWFNWSQVTTTMTQNNPTIFMTPGLNDSADSTEGGPSEMQLSFRVRF